MPTIIIKATAHIALLAAPFPSSDIVKFPPQKSVKEFGTTFRKYNAIHVKAHEYATYATQKILRRIISIHLSCSIG